MDNMIKVLNARPSKDGPTLNVVPLFIFGALRGHFYRPPQFIREPICTRAPYSKNNIRNYSFVSSTFDFRRRPALTVR